MNLIQLIACIGLITGCFVLLHISPMDFTEGVFRRITSKPKSIRSEVNESTRRKKKSFLRREIEETQTILRMTGRAAKFPMVCALSLLLFLVGAAFALTLGNLFLVPVLAVGMMFVPFWFIRLTANHYKKNIAAELETALSKLGIPQCGEQAVFLTVHYLLSGEYDINEVFPQGTGQSLLQKAQILLGLLLRHHAQGFVQIGNDLFTAVDIASINTADGAFFRAKTAPQLIDFFLVHFFLPRFVIGTVDNRR